MDLALSLTPDLEYLAPPLLPMAEAVGDALLLPAEPTRDNDKAAPPDDFSALLALFVPPPAVSVDQVVPETRPQQTGDDLLPGVQPAQTDAVAPASCGPELVSPVVAAKPDRSLAAPDLREQLLATEPQPASPHAEVPLSPAKRSETEIRADENTISRPSQLQQPRQVEKAASQPISSHVAVPMLIVSDPRPVTARAERVVLPRVLPSAKQIKPEQPASTTEMPPAALQTAGPTVAETAGPVLMHTAPSAQPIPAISRDFHAEFRPAQMHLPKAVRLPQASPSQPTKLTTVTTEPTTEVAPVTASPVPAVAPTDLQTAQVVSDPPERTMERPATPAAPSTPIPGLADTIVWHIAAAVAEPPTKAAGMASEPTEQFVAPSATVVQRASHPRLAGTASADVPSVALPRPEAADGPERAVPMPSTAPQVVTESSSAALPVVAAPAPQAHQLPEDQPAPEVSATERVATPPEASERPDEVVHQVRLALRPPDLGAVTLRIETCGKQVSAHLLVDQPVTGHVLRRAETEVRQLLQDQGLQVGSYEVDYQQPQQHQPHQRSLPMAQPVRPVAVPARSQSRQPAQESAIDVFA